MNGTAALESHLALSHKENISPPYELAKPPLENLLHIFMNLHICVLAPLSPRCLGAGGETKGRWQLNSEP